MINLPSRATRKRLKSLESHLREENPMLVDVVRGFRKLSRIGYATGLLSPDESYATQISWWPLISVLGTFSSGKSTFINHYLSYPLQDTGNQAVDDKFTVICYSDKSEVRVLPGLALDADPRFPFYQTSEELDKVAAGEGRRVDAYLQLKTCNSKNLKGRIVIDSPGFDADDQRSATLRLTNHIVDLSDLVLVFFDARHPEPGAMSDTLAHLVRGTSDRSDSSKFLYILNQIDTTAREDNPEEVFGAWQRALAREGLTAGHFYCVYNPDVSVPIEDPALRRRFEWKRDQDMDDILTRIDHVSVERSYRIIGALEKRANEIEEYHVPRIRAQIKRWRRWVLNAELLLLILVVAIGGAVYLLMPERLERIVAGFVDYFQGGPMIAAGVAAGLAALLAVHFSVRSLGKRSILARLRTSESEDSQRMQRAFIKNTRFWRSIFEVDPVGWSRRNRRRLREIINEADRYVQSLNDRFTDPSGRREAQGSQTKSSQAEEERVLTGEVVRDAKTP